jgi:hypothetical protein
LHTDNKTAEKLQAIFEQVTHIQGMQEAFREQLDITEKKVSQAVEDTNMYGIAFQEESNTTTRLADSFTQLQALINNIIDDHTRHNAMIETKLTNMQADIAQSKSSDNNQTINASSRTKEDKFTQTTNWNQPPIGIDNGSITLVLLKLIYLLFNLTGCNRSYAYTCTWQ